MESKGINSETWSSDQENYQDPVKETMNNLKRRSYVCTYCKRGFTNGQALGGHMNMHRKDRLVINAKQLKDINDHDQEFITKKYLMILESPENQKTFHHDFLFEQSTASRSTTINPRSLLKGNDAEEFLDSSLEIGSLTRYVFPEKDCDDDEEGLAISKEYEIDLELRLGSG